MYSVGDFYAQHSGGYAVRTAVQYIRSYKLEICKTDCIVVRASCALSARPSLYSFGLTGQLRMIRHTSYEILDFQVFIARLHV